MTSKTRSNEPSPRHRILHITFNMGFGGTEQVIRQLVMHLPKGEFTNEILCIDGEIGEIGQRLGEERGVTLHKLKRLPGLDWRLAIQIRRLIKRRDITILHCHQYTPWFYGWLGSLGMDVKRVFTEHGRFYPDRHRSKAWLFNKLMATTTDEIIAISEATASALSEYEYLPLRRIKIIYNGSERLDVEEKKVIALKKKLGIREDDFVLGTVARLDPVKNQLLMIEAIRNLLEKKRTVKLVIVGDGPEKARLQEYSQTLIKEKILFFEGFQSDPAPYYELMDVFLLTSDTEGTSMTLVEAMSCGVPAIVTDVGGNPEVISDDVNGYIIPRADVSALEIKIESLIENEKILQSLKKLALAEYRKRFSVTAMVSSYSEIYMS